jgi:hypothetical protein
MANLVPSGDKTYLDQVSGITADKRNRVIPHSNLRRQVILLDNALNAVQFRVSGDFVFFDSNSTGIGLVQLNNTSEDPWPALAQNGISDMPFQDIFITSTAQPGKVLNLWYGTRARFLTAAQAIASIGSIIAPVNVIGPRGMFGAPVLADQPVLSEDTGFAYGAAQASITLLAQNATEQVFAAASNINGAIIWAAEAFSDLGAVGIGRIGLLAKATAPTSAIDGDVIFSSANNFVTAVGIVVGSQYMPRSVRIASGKGLWWISSPSSAISENGSYRKVLYTLL